MAPSPTVLFIGLDSADPSMLRKWSGEGYLPNLRSFGVSCWLVSS